MWVLMLALSAIGISLPWAFSSPHSASSVIQLIIGIIIAWLTQYIGYLATRNSSPAKSSRNEVGLEAKGGRHRRSPPGEDRKLKQTVLSSVAAVMVGLIVIWGMAMASDDPEVLYGLSTSHGVTSSADMTGNVSIYVPVKAGVLSRTSFRTSGPHVRYFSSELELKVRGSSCVGSEVARYAFYSGSREIAHGAISPSGYDYGGRVSNIVIGAFESLRVDVSLHAQIGCSGDFVLADSALDRVTGWQQFVAESFNTVTPII
jgi:hypothetical protein